MPKTILLINPPIYDFAAFDLWAKPLGLLYLSAILKEQNNKIEFLDYCDRYSSLLMEAEYKNKTDKNACGHYLKTYIDKPQVLKNIPRKYCRYGVPKTAAETFLKSISKPDIIIITSIMTYWYLGVFEAIESARKIFPNTPIIIGGVYTTLCEEHFEQNRAVFFNNENIIGIKGSIFNLNSIFEKYQIPAKIPASFKDYPAPDYSFYNVSHETLNYAAIRMSLGCPFKCSYCAQNILCDNQFISKEPQKVFDEILSLSKSGIENIVFYDDALLYESGTYLKVLLRKSIKENLKIKFHTPNGLHLRYLDLELAELMKEANFIMPRFSLETSNRQIQKTSGNKIDNLTFENAVKILNKAGFAKGEFIIYLLMGMPKQCFDDIKKSMEYVHKAGGKISLSEYSIIPKTKDFENLDKQFFDEPLLHNKSVYPLLNNLSYPIDKNKWQKIYEIKLLAIKLNNSI